MAHKRPLSFCQKSGGWLYLSMHTPLTQWSRTGLTTLLSRHNVGTYPETSWHGTCQGTFSHSCRSLSHCGPILAQEWITVWELIVTLKKKRKKKVQAGNEWLNILPKSLQARIKPLPLWQRFKQMEDSYPAKTNLKLWWLPKWLPKQQENAHWYPSAVGADNGHCLEHSSFWTSSGHVN